MSAPSLFRPQPVSEVPEGGLHVEIVADEAERAMLAVRNEAVSIGRLVARLDLRRFGDDGLSVKGRLEAEVERICVVTLEPFVETVREAIDVRFAPAERLDPDREDDFDIRGEDPPDPYVGGAVDLGAVVAEFLSLGLDPYPRKPGASFAQAADDADGASPFAALRKLSGSDRSD